MSKNPIGRRDFLGTAALGAVGIVLGRPLSTFAAAPSALKIEEPFHGAVLNHRHGKVVDRGLAIRVSGKAPEGDRVLVGDKEAEREGERFTAEVVLRDRETNITVTSKGSSGRHEDRVRVVWDRHSFPRYRFSIDDNSFFLRDIFQKNYGSLFDCFYMAMLRDLHKKYGVKFTINIYYTTEDGFDISQFPDRYKPEWRDCAHWLKLAFHAYADKPDRPYQDAPPQKLLADLDLVAHEIHRFAGAQSYAPPTVIHWGMTRQEALKPLYKRGVRALSGYFRMPGSGRYDVNYRYDDVISQYVSTHDAWKDFKSGIVCSRVDIVCNSTPVDRIASTLEPISKDPNTAEIMDLFTHEQYFWPFYTRYIPDHALRLDTAIRWVTEHGYKPVFYHEGFLGAPV
ncbi:MAG: hypothetical protein WCV00_06630 [Verrucomicrobiia bacterium]